jgi:hypothetical protein
VSIYSPSNVKLCVSSRPSSFHPDHLTSTLSPASPGSPSPSEAQPEDATERTSKRSTSHWEAAIFEDAMGLTMSLGDRIRYEVDLAVWEEGETIEGIEGNAGRGPKMRVLVSLPPTYPETSPPQLQLLGRYLGDYNIDAGLCELLSRLYLCFVLMG